MPTLLRRLVRTHIGVVAGACALLVLATVAMGATLLRANQDDTLRELADGVCNGIGVELSEGLPMREAARDYFSESKVEGFRFELFDAQGHLLETQGAADGWDPAGHTLVVDGHAAAPGRPEGGPDRSFRALARWCLPGWAVRVVTVDVLAHSEVRHTVLVLLGAFPFAVLGGALLGRVLFRRSLRPLGELAAAATRSEAQPEVMLRAPAPVQELADLKDAFNGLLGRLGKALARERRFSQEASHELRTPLAVLRARLDTLAVECRERPEIAAKIGAALHDVDTLAALVDALLLLARAESAPLPDAAVNLCDLARDAALRQRLADGPEASALRVDAPDEVLVRGSEELLARAIGNLVENARKFAGPGGRIEIRVGSRDGTAFLSVGDDGPGIPAELRPSIFERFFRGPVPRATTGGAGLGLAVVEATVLRHRGTVEAAVSDLGGAEIRFELPLYGDDASASARARTSQRNAT